ncbi:hypothetical protein A3F37_04110 [Candidatus Saccharibacteria bacterium RIFCSPHIGHO2_12_FULL_41_12]|nr:MAG: hypothetical protein A3F37_04110 [Candidatus Saccharibacteria bacterium RIFCSPHIGHO2_12_FULL_41_12]
MKDIEIPLQPQKTKKYIFFEKVPALLSWSLLLLPIVLSQISPPLTALFILTYLLMWFARAIGMNIRVLHAWKVLHEHQRQNWEILLNDLEHRTVSNNTPVWHGRSIKRLDKYPAKFKPSEVVHGVIIAVYNESVDIVEPTIKAVIASNFDKNKIALTIACEQRGGKAVEKTVKDLIEKYRKHFMMADVYMHPMDIPDEVIGKGGNINFAGRKLQAWFESKSIDPARVLITILDADNRPHPNYLASLTYTFCLCPEPKYISFQPTPIFSNNIWDVPAPMRVIATGNSFWMVVLSMREHMLRNFSAHAQPLDALIETDFWSSRTIVEDGHQFWRSYFKFNGKYEVYPVYSSIYQDAVLAKTYRATLKAQFIQLRRWAWGASDIAYVAQKGFLTKNKVPKVDLFIKLFRLIEGHVSWATAPIIVTFAAFVPIIFNSDDIAANQLPNLASYIQRIAMVGLIITMYLSFKSLPPKPARYKRHRSIFLVFQWVLLPVTGILYNALSAQVAQNRLLFGKYLDKFDVTEKSVRK